MTAKGQRVELYAVVHVTNAGAATITWQSGEFVAVLRNGAGDVTLTLGTANGVADAELAFSFGANAGVVRITCGIIGDAAGPVTDATRDKRVLTTTGAGVATDTGFCLAIYRRLYI